MKKCAFTMVGQTQGSESQNTFSDTLELQFLKNLVRIHALFKNFDF